MSKKPRSAWAWIPTLYFAEGLPYVVIATSVLTLMYESFGLSNAQNTFLTSWLYLPWVIKPLWSPFVDILKTKRWWILTMQLVLGIGFACVAFLLPTSFYFQATLAMFWFMAFCSATHDIAADGFYMLGLNEEKQAFFVGIRSVFYKIATIFGEGTLVIIAGYWTNKTGNIPLAWSIVFFIISAILLAVFLYHLFFLPKPTADKPNNLKTAKEIFNDFIFTFVSFFKKKGIAIALIFMLLYRLGEALLVKMSPIFLKAAHEAGGLGLSLEQVGIVRNTVGVIALTVGGILGGIAVSGKGLKFWIWIMAFCITLPHLAYLYLSYFQPDNFILINIAVAFEQFGYGFGFTAYMMYLIYFSAGEHKTAHYAICTGFMALGMMLPGMIAGKLQEILGYNHFFVFVMICAIPTLAVIPFLKIEKDFGKKKKTV
ncbi:MAG: MFS transporter [Prevotellaceae bacterium]|jgi:PAT family beta-lactamase induction signal transducer AmpG|nr:MFS transporter [Prevotellaceae bacterium]